MAPPPAVMTQGAGMLSLRAALPLLLLAACTPAPGVPTSQKASPSEGYRSDYFVFLAADVADPLIIPVDVNWEPRPGGQVFTELKAWKGTRAPWPMIYEKETQPLSGRPFPRSFA